MLLACDVCASLPTEEDVRLRFGLHSGDDARSLPSDLAAAQAVLLACGAQRRQMVEEGRLGLGELQSLSAAAAKARRLLPSLQCSCTARAEALLAIPRLRSWLLSCAAAGVEARL